MRSSSENVRLLILDNISANKVVNCIANCDMLDRFATATLNPAYDSLLILLDISFAIVSKLLPGAFLLQFVLL